MIRDDLLQTGWRRHSIISPLSEHFPKLYAKLDPLNQKHIDEDGAVAIVATYDCALVDNCFEREPWLHLLIAYPSEFRKEFSRGRNPRTLHFSVCHEGEDRCYETTAACICQVERDVLLDLKPCDLFSIDGDNSSTLKTWLSERFRLETWPDQFNSSIRPANKKLRKFWSRYNEFISGVYLKLDSYTEKEHDDKYCVSAIIAVENLKFRQLINLIRESSPSLKEAPIDSVKSQLVNELVSAFGETIIFEEDPTTPWRRAIEIVSESNITLDHLRHFHRLSPYSLSEGDPSAPRPAELVPRKY